MLRASIFLGLLAAGLTGWSGCRLPSGDDCDLSLPDCPAGPAQLALEMPQPLCPPPGELEPALPPVVLSRDWPPPFEDLPLEQAIQVALQNSEVMRDMGGLVLRAPSAVRTVHDPAIQFSDPRFGEPAALSAFDASFSASAFWENNDRPLNNTIEALGANLFQQDLGLYSLELSKRTATGARLSLRHLLDYNFNNSPANSMPNLPWTGQLIGEIRQPLLQGAGVQYNRIAGPNGAPGINTGILIARVNTDVSLAAFEAAVIELVSNVENIYWELYFAYRDVDAKIAARNQALRLLETLKIYERNQQEGGSRSEVAQAEEQYFRLQLDVEDAITGRLLEKSNANVFRGTGGVLYYERRLRRAMGLPASTGHLLRPVTEPSMAKIDFEWDAIVQESLVRRVELRRQKWEIARSEMELLAARNYLLPQLDAVARYNFRGLGQDLAGYQDGDPFYSAYQNLATGDFQEWGLGVELTVPIGYRTGHAAVRNAELLVARSRAMLREQEQEVLSDLTAAVGEVDRAYLMMRTGFNRRKSAHDLVAALELARQQNQDEANAANILSRLLDAQRKAADADAQFFRSLSEYAFAIKQVHYEKGSLLDLNEVHLAEGPWPRPAYEDAARRARHFRPAPVLNHLSRSQPPIVSSGPFPQEFLGPQESSGGTQEFSGGGDHRR